MESQPILYAFAAIGCRQRRIIVGRDVAGARSHLVAELIGVGGGHFSLWSLVSRKISAV